MTMVKLLNLERAEVLHLIEALEHHCTYLRASNHQDASPYEELTEMLKRMAKLDGDAVNVAAPVAQRLFFVNKLPSQI